MFHSACIRHSHDCVKPLIVLSFVFTVFFLKFFFIKEICYCLTHAISESKIIMIFFGGEVLGTFLSSFWFAICLTQDSQLVVPLIT